VGRRWSSNTALEDVGCARWLRGAASGQRIPLGACTEAPMGHGGLVWLLGACPTKLHSIGACVGLDVATEAGQGGEGGASAGAGRAE
jgi:hypothetical protein